MRSARLMGWIGIGVALAGCTGGPGSQHDNRIYFSSQYDVRMPVSSMLERRYQRVVRQQYDFSCGAAALATLLTYHYGDLQSEQSVFLGMWAEGDRVQIRKVGFSLLEMKRYLAGRGISSDGFRVTLDQIANAQIPGVALVTIDGYRHFVVIKGLDRDSVLLGDPALGIRRVSRAEFSRIWNGVYFALNTQAAPKPRNFDLLADAALAPRPLVPINVQPIDLQVLSLLRPNLPLGEL